MPPVWTDIDGETMLDIACEFALEGVLAKRATSTYQPGRRSPAWVKQPLRYRTNVVLGGWIPTSRRAGRVASLLCGAYDFSGYLVYLVYLGHIGSGLTDRARRQLCDQLTQIECRTSPFASTAPRPRPSPRPAGSHRVSRAGLHQISPAAGCDTQHGKDSSRATHAQSSCPSVPNTIVGGFVSQRHRRWTTGIDTPTTKLAASAVTVREGAHGAPRVTSRPATNLNGYGPQVPTSAR